MASNEFDTMDSFRLQCFKPMLLNRMLFHATILLLTALRSEASERFYVCDVVNSLQRHLFRAASIQFHFHRIDH